MVGPTTSWHTGTCPAGNLALALWLGDNLTPSMLVDNLTPSMLVDNLTQRV